MQKARLRLREMAFGEGRLHLACVWPGSRRRSGVPVRVARIAMLQRLPVRNAALAHQTLAEFGAAEEGPSKPLVIGLRRSSRRRAPLIT